MNRRKSKSVSVSSLSYYAANPGKFCKAKGGPYNATAAKFGLKFEKQKTQTFLQHAFDFFLILLAIFGLILGLAWWAV